MNIAIKVDPGNSIATIDKVEQELAKVEKRGEAMKALGPTFTRIAQHMKFLADEAAKSRGAVDNLAKSFKGVADAMRADMLRNTGMAFAGLTEQIKREADMLERIRRPAKEFAEDMATLDMLHRRGALSAHEYADELARVGKNAGLTGTQHGLGAVSLEMPKAGAAGAGGMNAALDGMVGGLAGIAGPAALATFAVGELMDHFERMKQHTKDTNDATNSILKFHDGIESASAAMGEQVRLSEDLHINITKTTKAYGAVREATDGLGLSSKQMVDITRQLTAAVINDGGSIENVSTIMGKLQYAQDAGTMSARDLKAIWLQSDDVAEMFAKSLGVTYEQLMKMAKEGKLGTAAIEKMTKGLGDGTSATDKYAQRLLNIDEIMEEQHLTFVEAAEVLLKAKTSNEAASESIAQLTQRVLHAKEAWMQWDENVAQFTERIVKSSKHATDVMTDMFTKVQGIFAMATVNGGIAAMENTLKIAVRAAGIVDGLKTPWEKYKDEIASTTKALTAAGLTHEEVAKQLERVHPPEWVDYYKQELDAIVNPEKEWAGRIRALDSLLKARTISLEQYGAAMSKVTGYTREIGEGIHGNYALPKETLHTLDGKEYKPDTGVNGPPKSDDKYVDEYLGKRGNARKDLIDPRDVDEATEKVDKLSESMRAMQDSIAKGAQALGDSLIDAAMGADVAWTDAMMGVVESIGRAIVQALILQAIGGFGSGGNAGTGLLGAMQGGANGFDATVPGGRGPFLPGFAHGGDMLVGGSGGTDSKIAAFRVTPGESIHVRTPTQREDAEAASSAGGGGTTVVQNVFDRRALLPALRTMEGKRAILNVIRESPGLVRSLLGR